MTPSNQADLSKEQSLKLALQALQDWWKEMGVETPSNTDVKNNIINNKYIVKKSQVNLRISPSPKQKVQAGKSRLEYLAKSAEQAKAAPTFEALKHIMEAFDAGGLSDNARSMVFARGNPQADVMIIGEIPSRSDDENGVPFTDKDGALLDKMLAAIGLDETSVYISLACNWRPPRDRDPTELELGLSLPFLRRHLELVGPKLLILVGSISLQALCKKTGITKARGNWHALDIGGVSIPAMPIYPPRLLLNRPELKRDTWRDLLMIQDKLAALNDENS